MQHNTGGDRGNTSSVLTYSEAAQGCSRGSPLRILPLSGFQGPPAHRDVQSGVKRGPGQQCRDAVRSAGRRPGRQGRRSGVRGCQAECRVLAGVTGMCRQALGAEVCCHWTLSITRMTQARGCRLQVWCRAGLWSSLELLTADNHVGVTTARNSPPRLGLGAVMEHRCFQFLTELRVLVQEGVV